jgi:hypothetical protein
MLFSSLFGRGLLTMLAPDPGYEAWTMEEGLDGETDFHIADSPFMYTRGWDFVGVSSCLRLFSERRFLTPISRARANICLTA